MAIGESLQHKPCDGSDPDDFRPDSTWAIACDPTSGEGRCVRGLAVAVDVVALGDEVPLHTHPIDEVVFVEAGIAEIQLGSETRTVQPGAIVFVPAGTPHGGRPVGEASVRILGVFPSSEFSVQMLDRNQAPGTEYDAPQPLYRWDILQELESQR